MKIFILLVICTTIQSKAPEISIHNGTIFTTQGYLVEGLTWSHIIISLNLSETQKDISRIEEVYTQFFNEAMNQSSNENMRKRLLLLRNLNEEKYGQITDQLNEVMNSLQMKDNTEIVRHKRQIAIGLAALGGMIFGGAVTSLFSRFKSDTLYNVLEKRTNIISSRVEQNTLQILQNKEDIKRINSTLQYVDNQLNSIAQIESEFDHHFIGLITTYLMDNQFQKIELLCNALDQLYNGKLHKGLITNDGLEKALIKIKQQAQTKGLITGIQNIHELYQIPTSFMFEPTEKLLHVFVHIPLYHESHILTLYRFIPTPMPVLQEPQLMFIEVKPIEVYLARNNDGTLTRSLTNEELNDCLSLGHAYFCDSNALEKNNKPNCLNHLFNGLDHKSIKLCDGHLHPDISKITRINQTTYLIAESEYTTITSECYNKKIVKTFIKRVHPGTFLLTVDTNCTTFSENWVITPTTQMEDVIITSTITANDLDPVHLLQNFSTADLQLLHSSMKAIGHPIPISQLKGLSTFKSLLLQNQTEYWTTQSILTPSLSTIAIVIGIAVLLYLYFKRRCQFKVITKEPSIKYVTNSSNNEPIVRMPNTKYMDMDMGHYEQVGIPNAPQLETRQEEQLKRPFLFI